MMSTSVDNGTAPSETPPDAFAPLRTEQFSRTLDESIELLSQPRQAFLIGAGVSKCAGLPLMSELTDAVVRRLDPASKALAIMRSIQGNFGGARACTLEDYMSELVDLISIAERRSYLSVPEARVPLGEGSYSLQELNSALSQVKQSIRQEIGDAAPSIDHHRNFIRTIHGRLQMGKGLRPAPVQYFTLNYDTLLEDALALERIPLVDGFCGAATAWWCPECYDDQRALAHVFKVHGSIDWSLVKDDPMPRRIRPGLMSPDAAEPVLIWPAATKYKETQRDPYAQIINRMRCALRPPQHTELILSVLGYSFSDRHVNAELDSALRESEGRLTIMVFTSTDLPTGILSEWLAEKETARQVRVHANRGFFHAEDTIPSSEDLAWWRFELLARLLGGEK